MARHLTSRSVGADVVARVAERLSTGGDLDDVGPRQLTAALVRLVDLGAAVWEADGEVRWTSALSVAEALGRSAEETEREDEVERSRIEMMRRYAEHTGCRWSFLLSYFGQSYPGPCGRCDNDLKRPSQPSAIEPFPVGERVVSDRWAKAPSSATTATS
jgi:ATP-dependent DNA helicase RecQ